VIALFFGSFNPIHIGHLIIADTVLLEKSIKKVWFVVSPQNPFKSKESLLTESARYYLTQLATEDHPDFFVSNI
jgi:nicotinate-nucleotide adenylyltransferase